MIKTFLQIFLPLNITQTLFSSISSPPAYYRYRDLFLFLVDTWHHFWFIFNMFSYSPYLTLWNTSLKLIYSWLQSLWIWSRSLGHLILIEDQLHEPICSIILSTFTSKKYIYTHILTGLPKKWHTKNDPMTT